MTAFLSESRLFDKFSLIRWPVYLLIPVGFGFLMLQAMSELIMRATFLTGNGPDVIISEDAKLDDQKKVAELEAQTARLLAGGQ